MTKCATKYCRNDSALTVLGVPMCDACWEKKCDAKAEQTAQVGHYADGVMCHICDEREAIEGLDICVRCEKLQADAWAEQAEQPQEVMLK